MLLLHHLTLTTGHLRASPRTEVGDDILSMLRPIITCGHGEVAGLCVEITDRAPLVFTLGWVRDRPHVRCVLCAVPDDGAAWRYAIALAAAAGQDVTASEPPAPWLAVVILPHIAGLDQDRTAMLGDAERCVAWALMESGT